MKESRVPRARRGCRLPCLRLLSNTRALALRETFKWSGILCRLAVCFARNKSVYKAKNNRRVVHEFDGCERQSARRVTCESFDFLSGTDPCDQGESPRGENSEERRRETARDGGRRRETERDEKAFARRPSFVCDDIIEPQRMRE